MISVIVSNIDEVEIVVDGEAFTHLKSALRVKTGDNVLAIDGFGKRRLTTVLEVGKKKLSLGQGQIEQYPRLSNIDILLSPPKRDALNDSLRMACELGVRNIYLFPTEYTQNKKLDLERMKKVLHSAVVQSNNLYVPGLYIIKSLSEIETQYQSVRAFHLSNESEEASSIKEDLLLAIGPEGGFSKGDISHFKETYPELETVMLRTPILRTPTALCAAFSWALSRI
ncbi:MAG: 16S rRNA (uracil1498-N3)-methyltransferase [Bacteriovoracaceae bacterium]|jgi:16S rRNA (uracil1498-N3)-methyltransferase